MADDVGPRERAITMATWAVTSDPIEVIRAISERRIPIRSSWLYYWLWMMTEGGGDLKATYEQIAVELDVSTRTMSRRMADLQRCGVVNVSQGGDWRLPTVVTVRAPGHAVYVEELQRKVTPATALSWSTGRRPHFAALVRQQERARLERGEK